MQFFTQVYTQTQQITKIRKPLRLVLRVQTRDSSEQAVDILAEQLLLPVGILPPGDRGAVRTARQGGRADAPLDRVQGGARHGAARDRATGYREVCARHQHTANTSYLCAYTQG